MANQATHDNSRWPLLRRQGVRDSIKGKEAWWSVRRIANSAWYADRSKLSQDSTTVADCSATIRATAELSKSENPRPECSNPRGLLIWLSCRRMGKTACWRKRKTTLWWCVRHQFIGCGCKFLIGILLLLVDDSRGFFWFHLNTNKQTIERCWGRRYWS